MYRRLTIILLLIALLIPLASVQADATDDALLCGDLSESDCQIILDNNAVMNEVNAFAFDMSMYLEADGDRDEDDMELTLAGSGALEIDADTLAELNAVDSMAMALDIAPLLESLLTGLTGELSISVAQSSAEGDSDLQVDLRIKQGVLLVNAAVLEAATGESMSGLEWLGLDLNGAVDELLGEAGLSDMSDMTQDQMDEMAAAEAAAMATTRLPDSEINGVAVAVFESTLDLETIMSLLSLEAMGMSESGQDAEMTMAMLESMEVRDLSMRQYIGLVDLYSHRIEMSMDMTVFPARASRESPGRRR